MKQLSLTKTVVSFKEIYFNFNLRLRMKACQAADLSANSDSPFSFLYPPLSI